MYFQMILRILFFLDARLRRGTTSRYAMLCYAMLCYVMLCYVMLESFRGNSKLNLNEFKESYSEKNVCKLLL